MNNLSIKINPRDLANAQGLGQASPTNPASKIESIKPADLRVAALLDRDATDDVQRIPLSQLLLLQRGGQSSRQSRKRTSPDAAAADTHESETDDNDLRVESLLLVEDLRGADKTALSQRLTSKFDSLEEHTLLMDAMSRVNQMALPSEEREELLAQLQQMIDQLMTRDGEAVEEGVAHQQAYEKALNTMGALAAPDALIDESQSLSELRAMYGSKGDESKEAPLTPLSLARLLQDKFGADNFSAAMGDLRSKMAASLRNAPPATPGPLLWLSLGDAACFNMLQTGFALAGSLRRDLWDQAGILAKTGQTATAILLLNWADSGEDRAEVLGESIVGAEDLDALQSALLYLVLYRALSKLPAALWRLDLLRRRMDLLDNLKSKAVASSATATKRDEEQEFEERLRDTVDGVGRRREDGEGEEDGEEDQRRRDKRAKRRKEKYGRENDWRKWGRQW